MTLRLIISICCLFAFHARGVIPDAPMAKTVWISPVAYGQQKGTRANPFDGSTAEKFDALMRSFPPFSTINLLEGTFQTTGSASYNETNGWWFKEGWKVRGRGMTNTTVRQVYFPSVVGAKHGTFEMTMYDRGGGEVSGLTIDENSQAFADTCCTFAVSLYGQNNVIRNVQAINGRGNWKLLLESYALAICARYGANGWEVGTNNVIERCVVRDYQGDYGSAFALMLGAYGKIRNCSVTNFNGTAPIGIAEGVIYEFNNTINCWGGYYCDSTVVSNAVIRNCLMTGPGYKVHINPCFGDALARKITVENRRIETQPNGIGVAMSGILGPGYQYDIVVRSNTFTGPGNPIIAAYVGGLTVEDNQAPPDTISFLDWPEYPSYGVVARRNRMLGAPAGMEDRP